ncbi:hypothetical protein CHU98_g10423 [Xylaria longipes]|nr:hypothetical protein CHU98_g10423 [Xylaria longipes]
MLGTTGVNGLASTRDATDVATSPSSRYRAASSGSPNEATAQIARSTRDRDLWIVVSKRKSNTISDVTSNHLLQKRCDGLGADFFSTFRTQLSLDKKSEMDPETARCKVRRPRSWNPRRERASRPPDLEVNPGLGSVQHKEYLVQQAISRVPDYKLGSSR